MTVVGGLADDEEVVKPVNSNLRLTDANGKCGGNQLQRQLRAYITAIVSMAQFWRGGDYAARGDSCGVRVPVVKLYFIDHFYTDLSVSILAEFRLAATFERLLKNAFRKLCPNLGRASHTFVWV
jgi:hypothetical protein